MLERAVFGKRLVSEALDFLDLRAVKNINDVTDPEGNAHALNAGKRQMAHGGAVMRSSSFVQTNVAGAALIAFVLLPEVTREGAVPADAAAAAAELQQMLETGIWVASVSSR